MVTEKKGGRGGRGKDASQLFCSHKTKNHWNVEIVNPYITLLYLWGFRTYKFPAHFMWTTIRFTENFVDGHHKGHSIES